MNSNSARSAARKVGGVVLVAAGIGIGGYLLLILADIATLWWVFSRMSTVLSARGVDSDLANIYGVAFAVFSAFAAHGILWLLLTRKTRLWALRIGAIMLVWYGAIYAVSYPYSGGAINVWTGQAQVKYYRDSSNRIVTMPIGAKTGPEGQPLQVIDPKTAEEHTQQDMEKETTFNVFTGLPQFKYYRDSQNRIVLMPLTTKTGPEGQQLQVIDQKTAEEYKKQGVRKGPWNPRKPLTNPYSKIKSTPEVKQTDDEILEEFMKEMTRDKFEEHPEYFKNTTVNSHMVMSPDEIVGGMFLWAEKIQVAPDRTVVHLACRGKDEGHGGWLFPQTEYSPKPYMVDESGRIYSVLSDSAAYDSTYTFKAKSWWEYDRHVAVRHVLEGEVYHFALTFQPLAQGVSELRLHLLFFGPTVDLAYALAEAEKVPPVDTPTR